MAAHQFKARLIWTGAAKGPAVTYDGYCREHLIEIDGKPSLRGSSDPLYRGDPALHNPEDLLVASLSACHMLWYLHLCTDAGIHVSAYTDDAFQEKSPSPRSSCVRGRRSRGGTWSRRSPCIMTPTAHASLRTRSIFRCATRRQSARPRACVRYERYPPAFSEPGRIPPVLAIAEGIK